MEKDIRRERQTIGIKRALSQGVKFGPKVIDGDSILVQLNLKAPE
tara:strand:+ start:164 stop:298 length:135 start_codon:yes stop_codon:yes gene_type:complete